MIARYFQALAGGVAVAAFLAPFNVRAADVAMPRVTHWQQPPQPQQQPQQPRDPRWCYAGVHGGLMQLNYDIVTNETPYGQSPYKPVENVKGTHFLPLIGAQIGCNYIQQNIMIGIEAETWIVPGTPPDCSVSFDPVRDCVTIREKPAFAGSLRAGFIHGNFLFFGKLGLAYLTTDIVTDHHRTISKANTPFPDEAFQYNENHKRRGTLSQSGLLLGFGAEYMIDENWSTKIEVNKVITASDRKNFDAVLGPGSTVCDNNDDNYKCFGTTGVVANRDTSGAIAKQTARFGRGIFKIGVNRRF
jgi:hypothetical protein